MVRDKLGSHDNVKKASRVLALSDREIKRHNDIDNFIGANKLDNQVGRFLKYQIVIPQIRGYEQCLNLIGKDRASQLLKYGEIHGIEALNDLCSYLIGNFKDILKDNELEAINANIINHPEKFKGYVYEAFGQATSKIKSVYSALLQIEKELITQKKLTFEERNLIFKNIVDNISKGRYPISDIKEKREPGFFAVSFDLSNPRTCIPEDPARLPKEYFPSRIAQSGSVSFICVDIDNFDENAIKEHIKWCRSTDKYYKPYIWFFESEKGNINIKKLEGLGISIIFLHDCVKGLVKKSSKGNLEELARKNLETLSKKLFELAHPQIKQK